MLGPWEEGKGRIVRDKQRREGILWVIGECPRERRCLQCFVVPLNIGFSLS